ncbi:hypothetical protein M408DRAFT_332444 [Serendipita vermifera MAFF 305830]|uniref:RZ-type domain-containing protein n=1 Tax=Serendipita vermifera MAFF 305830 TaxID=933852 RepID=A0A0C3AT95_SERVB|nr:hypothetical protein M408DRAFT_332444 [Serendipita vermifera MAFF 305830]
MERLLDVQFRLLREELLAPLRHAVKSITAELQGPSPDTPLQHILDKKGGRYIAQFGQNDSVMVNIYTSFNPVRIATDKRGISIETTVDTPPGSARHTSIKERTEYWRAVSRKRLIQGGLVGLLWKNGADIRLFFGLISNSAEELIERIENGDDQSLHLRIKFFDPTADLTIMDRSQLTQRNLSNELLLLIEAPVMYESIRPFLSALQREPTSFPFSQYLAYHKFSPGIQTESSPPEYTTNNPDFEWNLGCLRDETQPPLFMNPTDQDSINRAREVLQSSSRLDVSQANAMIHCLTSEFCLIQGPPGTGKSFTGVEIMRVLLANKARRILLIAFTNHALDHLLRSVLDAKITSKIARLGSRSNDDRISEYSLEKLEQRNSGILQSAYWDRKGAEDVLNEALNELQDGVVSDSHIDEYMKVFRSEHRYELLNPPKWIRQIRQEEEDGWTEVRNQKAQKKASPHEFWVNGKDIDWIDAQLKPVKRSKKAHANRFELLRVEGVHGNQKKAPKSGSQPPHGSVLEDFLRRRFLDEAGLREMPRVPLSDRPLDELGEDPMVWLMSRQERCKLNQSWTSGAQQHFIQETKEAFLSLKKEFEDAQAHYVECQAQARLDILRNVDIIGCTTTGAAKLTDLLKSVNPSVLLVEEAGQVLEAHILGSLVPSIEHVILIGDPLQLRPTISNYALSMDHPRGRDLYRFDQSTMERLRGDGMPMAQLNTQRRMRPQISSLARRTLYADLEDNDLVKTYPDVRGLAKNLFFFHHENAEGGNDEESTSKFNRFEASMIKGLVRHLLRQGCYTKPGSIVILCMYLGQLIKIREELREIRINVTLDSRDEADIRNREPIGNNETEDAIVEVVNVKATEQVLLRTVDNFQGEEADIILLSLVRNPEKGTPGSIGFLKSPNRTNVALTRARHGLYVFGNGHLLAQKSVIWNQVVQEFKDQDAYGSSLPIACHKHPNEVKWVANPNYLLQVSPEGGCLRSCDYRLKCGHTCNLKCHSDDEDHLFVKCKESCRRVCAYGHSCQRECWVDCTRCSSPVSSITLGCGHFAYNSPCYLQDDQSSYRCREIVSKQIPSCKHQMNLPCFRDPSMAICETICNQVMPCCQKICKSRCGKCRLVSHSDRGQHEDHSCDQTMYCQHPCPDPCNKAHKSVCRSSDCQEKCRQRCVHVACDAGCSTPCNPCDQPCTWTCEHYECSSPCGLPCTRLPCDIPCTRTLSCGHLCPSLCGEPCEQQRCGSCLGISPGPLYSDPLSSILRSATITLKCRHTFLVEALDRHSSLASAYEQDRESRSWIRPILSPEVSLEQSCCPTCHDPIDSPRYGRVVKRGNIDLLERNIASVMAKELKAIKSVIIDMNLHLLEKAIVEKVVTNPGFKISSDAWRAILAARDQLLNNRSDSSIFDVGYFGDEILTLFNLPKAEIARWCNVVDPLLKIYESCERLSDAASPPHLSVYETLLASLHGVELHLAQEKHASLEAKKITLASSREKIGIRPPRASKRFQVESIWMSIAVRFMVGWLAEKYIFALLQKSGPNHSQIKAWYFFVDFIYKSCLTDAKLATKLSQDAIAYHQELVSRLFYIKSRWTSFQFNASFNLSKGGGRDSTERISAAKKAEKRLVVLKESAKTIRTRCISQGGLPLEVVQEEFDTPLERCFSQWESLINTLQRTMATYKPVRETGRSGIVALTQYGNRGIWHICPNGHISTTEDLRGGVITSRCNECSGAAIEGTGYEVAVNVRQVISLDDDSDDEDIDFAAIARAGLGSYIRNENEPETPSLSRSGVKRKLDVNSLFQKQNYRQFQL